jgi:hypothetical protein
MATRLACPTRRGTAAEARGPLRRAHDVALVDWAAVRPGGEAAVTGTHVMRFAPDGRIAGAAVVAGV